MCRPRNDNCQRIGKREEGQSSRWLGPTLEAGLGKAILAGKPEAFERMEVWLIAAPIREDRLGLSFRPARTARGDGRHGFATRPMTPRAVPVLITRYVRALRLDPNVSRHWI
jgi:hypothetical protein